MFCKHCGTQLSETAKFCPTCGKINELHASIAESTPAPAPAPAPTYVEMPEPAPAHVETPAPAPVYEEAPAYVGDPAPISEPSANAIDSYSEATPVPAPPQKGSGGGILTFAILGLAFGCTWILSILGLVFSYVAKAKINNYVIMYGETEGSASVGKGLSTAGLIVSWIMSAIFVFYFLIIVVLVGMLL